MSTLRGWDQYRGTKSIPGRLAGGPWICTATILRTCQPVRTLLLIGPTPTAAVEYPKPFRNMQDQLVLSDGFRIF